ncbi:MAG: hypothetical protein AB7S75_23430, partial [Desulfococcaceae bacterium]
FKDAAAYQATHGFKTQGRDDLAAACVPARQPRLPGRNTTVQNFLNTFYTVAWDWSTQSQHTRSD